MTYEELKSRIKIMSMEDVKLMSPHNVAILTDNFCEELVKYIIIQAKTNPRQREMMNVIIQKYDEWRKEMGDVLWGSPVFGGKRDYPEHIKSLEFEIECGNTITEKGIIPPQQKATLTIQCPPLDYSKVLKPIKDALEQNDATIQKEFEGIKEQLDNKLDGITEEEFNEIFDGAENFQTSDNGNTDTLKKQLEEAQKRINELEEENKQLKAQLDNQGLPSEESDERTIKLLTPLFFNNENDARNFFTKVKGLDNQTITDVVWDFVLARKLSPNSRNSKLWTILYAAGIYLATDRNWDTALRNNPKALTWGRQQL